MPGFALYTKAAQSVPQTLRRLVTCLQTCLIESTLHAREIASPLSSYSIVVLPALVALVNARPELQLLAIPALVVVDDKAFVLERRVPQQHRIPNHLANPVLRPHVPVTLPKLSKSSVPIFVAIDNDAVLTGRRRPEQAGRTRPTVKVELLPAAVKALPQLHPLPMPETVAFN